MDAGRDKTNKAAVQEHTGQDGLELLRLITSVRARCRVQASEYVVEIAEDVIETKIVPSRRSLGLVPGLALDVGGAKVQTKARLSDKAAAQAKNAKRQDNWTCALPCERAALSF
jgi:hypothetical protein